MSWISKIFGSGAGADGQGSAKKKSPDPVDHAGYTITPGPMSDGGAYRIAALIEKTVDGEVKSHQLIRADTVGSFDEAVEISLMKAKSVIDQQGDGIFE